MVLVDGPNLIGWAAIGLVFLVIVIIMLFGAIRWACPSIKAWLTPEEEEEDGE